jgi:hypothetical protein
MSWTKREPRTIGPAALTDQERYDGAQWYFYKFLSRGEPLAPRRDPEPDEI